MGDVHSYDIERGFRFGGLNIIAIIHGIVAMTVQTMYRKLCLGVAFLKARHGSPAKMRGLVAAI